jgi:hypothetical protein
MATKAQIVNKSLTNLGAAPIVSLDDDSQNANIVNRVYETSLRAVLSETRWNFATKRALLSELEEELDWHYTGEGFVYSRPSDAIRIFESNAPNAIWREEGDYIISDTQGLGVLYVYYLDDPAKYPSFFIDAFSDKLSSEIAYMILNSAEQGKMWFEKYSGVSLPKARAENAQIGVHAQLKDDYLINAKITGIF